MLDEEEEEVEKVEKVEEEVVERQHEESLEMRLPSPGANHSFTLCIIFLPGRVEPSDADSRSVSVFWPHLNVHWVKSFELRKAVVKDRQQAVLPSSPRLKTGWFGFHGTVR